MSDSVNRDAVLAILSDMIGFARPDVLVDAIGAVRELPTASPWHRAEEPPEEAGEYIVAYHPCWWDDVKTKVTKVGIDSFRGKASWAKRKTQRVTHWMDKPEPPQEENDA